MGGHIHIRRLLRFGFDNWESRKFTLVRQRQSNETPHWVYCIQPVLYPFVSTCVDSWI
jgi:hypothetical protein